MARGAVGADEGLGHGHGPGQARVWAHMGSVTRSGHQHADKLQNGGTFFSCMYVCMNVSVLNLLLSLKENESHTASNIFLFIMGMQEKSRKELTRGT